jgi:SAM-dependent methyltransferase
MVHKNGLNTEFDTVAELGPGDSLGIGLAALLTGSRRYYAFDVVESANLSQNLSILDDLLRLFSRSSAIPHSGIRFSEVKPHLESYDFPNSILTQERLSDAQSPERLQAIREQLSGQPQSETSGLKIRYMVPWHDRYDLAPESVDLVYSQAVLEHVDRLEDSYQAMSRWLKPGGLMSHQIDFRSHGTAKHWNGHWAYPDAIWKLIRGKRPYLISRQPLSAHLDAMRGAGFEIIAVQRFARNDGLPREALARRFSELSEKDLETAGAFVQARKHS